MPLEFESFRSHSTNPEFIFVILLPEILENSVIERKFEKHMLMFFLFVFSGEITTHEPLDRELRAVHELVLEARDQGMPSRAARVPLRVTVLDVNDNSPEIVDPQGDVVSVREEQPSGTEVARVRALDTDRGENASVTYSILKGDLVTAVSSTRHRYYDLKLLIYDSIFN